ncbi:MAG: HAMP domain-containing sensor histidine kinase [Candidatus Eisenbacteria bacterium]
MTNRGTPRGKLEKLARKESVYWILSAVLLTLLSGVVIVQFLTAEVEFGDDFFSLAHDRHTLAIGLPGLVILFCLYVTMKRREISRLKTTLYDQRALLGRLEERTRELEKTLEELTRVSRLKDNLLGTVSHELQTPLTSIHSVAQLLMKYGNDPESSHEDFYKIIYNETKRLSSLVDNLLDLARIESGKMVWELSVLEPKEIIRAAVALSSLIARERKIALREETAAPLPPVLVDRDRMVQVMMNLIGNALKFTPPRGLITLSAAVEKSGDRGEWVRFSVRDTGPGVPEAERERVFEWFHQAPGEGGGKIPGTGLGLAICREIVEHFGGRIWVENAPGGGAEFLFTVPVTKLATVDPVPDMTRDKALV